MPPGPPCFADKASTRTFPAVTDNYQAPGLCISPPWRARSSKNARDSQWTVTGVGDSWARLPGGNGTRRRGTTLPEAAPRSGRCHWLVTATRSETSRILHLDQGDPPNAADSRCQEHESTPRPFHRLNPLRIPCLLPAPSRAIPNDEGDGGSRRPGNGTKPAVGTAPGHDAFDECCGNSSSRRAQSGRSSVRSPTEGRCRGCG